MNINPISYNNYIAKLTGSGASTSVGASDASVGEPTPRFQDTITISRHASSQNLCAGMGRRIAGEIAEQDSPARVEALRTAVSNGTYFVPASLVAGEMLSRQIING